MPSREDMQALGQQIIQSHGDRIGAITELRKDVGAYLADLDKSHWAMAKNLWSELARDDTERKVMVGAMLKGLDSDRQAMARGLRADLARGKADCQAMVGAQLAEFDGAHQAMARGLRAELARGKAEGKAAVGPMLREFQREEAGVRKEQAAGRAEWRKLVATMGSKRSAAMVHPSASSSARPEAPPSAPKAEEVAGGSPEFAALCNRAFRHLANRPEGARLVELEGEMHMGRFQMSRVLRSLMDTGKVEKRDMLYFAM